MLRIIHIVHSLQNGGLERVVTSLAGDLAERGHRLWICCLRTNDELIDLLPASIPLIDLTANPHHWSLVCRLRRIFRKYRPDIVHTHNWGTWPEATVAAASLPGLKIVQTFHGFIEAMPPRRRLAAPVLARMTDRLTTVSASLAQEAGRFCRLDPLRFQVIHNGVDCRRFRPRSSNETFPSARRHNSVDTWCASVGSLTPAKHPENLLQAVHRLPSNIGMMWIGQGPLQPRVIQMTRRLGIDDRVQWLGYRPDVRPLLEQADIIVSSSRTEALPLNLLEAMSMAKSVVATRVGGVPEIITNGYDGLTVPAENPVALADAIETLARDRRKRALFGRRASRRVAREFTLARMADQYEDLYRRICQTVPHSKGPRS